MWLLIMIGVLFALPVIIGFFLPVRYEGSTTVEFDRGVQRVWDALQDIEAHPMTGKMMKSVETLPADQGRPAWTEDMGRGEIVTVTTTAFEPHRHMVREMSSGSVNMISRWEYALDPAGEGCKVTLSGVTTIEKGTWHTPIFRLMMVVGGGVKKGLDIQLEMVAVTLETERNRAA
jgi:hypothetical protein